MSEATGQDEAVAQALLKYHQCKSRYANAEDAVRRMANDLRTLRRLLGVESYRDYDPIFHKHRADLEGSEIRIEWLTHAHRTSDTRVTVPTAEQIVAVRNEWTEAHEALQNQKIILKDMQVDWD